MNWRTAMNTAAAMSRLSHHGERDRMENRLRFAIMAISGFYNANRQPLAHFGAFMAVAGFVAGLDGIGDGRSPRSCTSLNNSRNCGAICLPSEWTMFLFGRISMFEGQRVSALCN